jgi:hypothetical protein
VAGGVPTSASSPAGEWLEFIKQPINRASVNMAFCHGHDGGHDGVWGRLRCRREWTKSEHGGLGHLKQEGTKP